MSVLGRTKRPISAARVACIALAAVASGCAKEPAPKSWPAGTVLALDDAPISIEDVDSVADIIARIEPEDGLAQVRRVALTNVVLPRLAGQKLGGEAREKARALATEYARSLSAGQSPPAPLDGPALQRIEGDFSAVGLEAWRFAIDASIGRWSDVIETVGGFELVRVDERKTASTPRETHFVIGLYFFAYVDPKNPRGAVEAALDRAKLTYVEESWRDVVPTSWQYRLRGGTP